MKGKFIMEALRNIDLVELKLSEQKNITGGFAFLATIAAGLIIAAGTEIISDWDNFERGFSGQPYKE